MGDKMTAHTGEKENTHKRKHTLHGKKREKFIWNDGRIDDDDDGDIVIVYFS